MTLFFAIPIYLLINIYIIKRTLKWMGFCHVFFKHPAFKATFLSIYIFMASSLLIAFFLPDGQLHRIMKLLSNYWLGTLLYIIMFLAVGDLIYVISKRILTKEHPLFNHRRYAALFGGVIVGLIIAVSFYGIHHARVIKDTRYDVTINKSGGTRSDLKIALIADIHLGYNITSTRLEKIVNRINAQNPDIVLIAGDIYDNEYDALDDPDKICSLFKSLKSTYGTYAVYGNHDVSEQVLGGFTVKDTTKKSDPRMDQLLANANVHILSDESVLIDNSFYLVGRRDKQNPGTDDNSRQSIASLMQPLDSSKPVFVLAHEPNELKETAAAGADIDFSGHTHNGQIFPGNLLIKAFWENPTGFKQYDQMSSIVTSGVGLWGPNMRVCTDAEIVTVNVHFQK